MVFVGPNFVLSARSNSTQGFLGVRARTEREPELLQHGSGFVFYALMDAVVDRYFPIVDALETELEAIEGQIFERGAGRANIERLYELKRRVMMVRHAVMPLMDAASKLFGGRVPRVCSKTVEYFRDVHDHLARIGTSIDAIRETIGTAIQVNLSAVTIEESETTKRLAAWAGIFAVGDRVRRHLGHELRAHAGAGVEVRLSGGARADRRHLRAAVPEIPPRRLAVRLSSSPSPASGRGPG